MPELIEKSIHFTSLGCSKNLVDSEVMLGHLGLDGFHIRPNPEEAETIIVNTCSFIEAAKTESIDTILDMADYKQNGRCKALVVSGCMPQRYASELEKELPEVDLFIGTGEYHKIVFLLKTLSEGKLEKKSFVEIPKYIHTESDPRLHTTPSHMAWLKVSEGCNRNCTFCIIPTLRGKLRSRSINSLVEETNNLVAKGVKEINVISQDLSDYGHDLGETHNLESLLLGLEESHAHWIRLFYYYPDDLSDKAMDILASSKKICPYLDMPVQHFSDSVLKRMNRQITGQEILAKIRRLRQKIPEITLRSSVIVGFPGETQDDFGELIEGLKQARFDHLGVFKYSDEEGTPAYRLGGKISSEVIDERFEKIYALQKEIAKANNQKYVGKTLEVLIEGKHPETDLLLQGRHIGQAPDIDGCVIINEGWAHPGSLVSVEISECHDYDLVGRVVRD